MPLISRKGNSLAENNLKASPMPPVPFLWLVVVGCFCYISLLKIVLVRWCPDVVSLSRVLQSTVVFGADVVSFLVPKRVIWHACCVQFDTFGDHRAIQGDLEAQERRPWGPSFDFCRFSVDCWTAIGKFLANFGTRNVFFVMRVYRSRFFNDFGD